MDQYFSRSNFKSFMRQLYHYGFRKTVSGPDYGVFHHPRFMRSDPKGSMSIKRKHFTPGDRRPRKTPVFNGRLEEKRNNRLGEPILSPGFPIADSPEELTPMADSQEVLTEDTRDGSVPPAPFTPFISSTILDSATRRILPPILTPRHSSESLEHHQQVQLTHILNDVLIAVEDDEVEFMNPSSIPHIIKDRPKESLFVYDQKIKPTILRDEISSKEDGDDSEVRLLSPAFSLIHNRVKQLGCSSPGECIDFEIDDMLLTPRSIEEMILYPH